MLEKGQAQVTAIAVFKNHNWPIFVGDIVRAGDEVSGLEVLVPTVGSTRRVFPTGSGYVVNGTSQKIVICHDYLAVAWTGNAVAAASLLRELCDLSSPNRENVERCYREQGSSKATEELQTAGYLYEPNVDAFVFFFELR